MNVSEVGSHWSYRNNEHSEEIDRISAILGTYTDEVIRSCVYYDVLRNDKTWIHRQVDSVEFESDRTIKRKHSIDIDFNIINLLREQYNLQRECYIPIVENLQRGPFLNVDLGGSNISKTTLARRHENAVLGAACILGSIFNLLINKGILERLDKSWVIPFISCLVKYEKCLDDMKIYPHYSPAISFSEFVLSTRISLPLEVANLISEKRLEFAFQQYQRSYTLYVRTSCSSKKSVAFTKAGTEGIGTVKFTRYERADIKDEDRSNINDGFATNRRRFSPLLGTEYIITIPLFGQSKNLGGLHTRVVCPPGMTFDSVSIFQGDKPFMMERLPDGPSTPKHWALHYGYVDMGDVDYPAEGCNNLELESLDKDIEVTDASSSHVENDDDNDDDSAMKPPCSRQSENCETMTTARKNSNHKQRRVALEMIYNRRRIELHDLCLPPADPNLMQDGEKAGERRKASAVWQIKVKMSSSRAKFLVPALGLLICTMFALTVNIIQIWRNAGSGDAHDGISTISSVSTLSLPLLLGFLIVGDEHLVLSQALGNLRRLVGVTTLLSVITACTLSVLDKNGMSICYTQGRITLLLFAITFLLGGVSICLILVHIRRIQRYRTPAFEYWDYLKDEARFRVMKEGHSTRVGILSNVRLFVNLYRHHELKKLWNYRRSVTRQMLSYRLRFCIMLFVITLIALLDFFLVPGNAAAHILFVNKVSSLW